MFKTDPDYFAIIYFLPPCSFLLHEKYSWLGKCTVPVQGEIFVPVQSEPHLPVPVENSLSEKNDSKD